MNTQKKNIVKKEKPKKSVANAIMAYTALYGAWLIGALMSINGAYLFLGVAGAGIGTCLEMAEVVILSILVFQLAKKVLPIGVIIFLIVIGTVLSAISCFDQAVCLNKHFANDVSDIIEMRSNIVSLELKIASIEADIERRSAPYKDLKNTVVEARKRALNDAGIPELQAQITTENNNIFEINKGLLKLEKDKKLSLYLYESMAPGIVIALLLKLAQLSMIFIVSFAGIFNIPEKEEPEYEAYKEPEYEADEGPQQSPRQHHYEEEQEPEPEPEIIEEEYNEAVNHDIFANHSNVTPMRPINGGKTAPPKSSATTHEEDVMRAVVMDIVMDKEIKPVELAKALGRSLTFAEDFLKGRVELSEKPFTNFRKKVYGHGPRAKADFNRLINLKEQEIE